MGHSQSKVQTEDSSSEQKPTKIRQKIKYFKQQCFNNENSFGKFMKMKKSSSGKNGEKSVKSSSTLTRRMPILTEFDYDLEAKRRMQEQLAFNSDIFVLNQMMLSVQFFGNFERDMIDAVNTNRMLEDEKTDLITKHCKTIILPNRLHAAVDNWIKFSPKHGPQKSRLFTLQNQTMYVIHDNIEVINPGETSVYSILSDAPMYKFQIDDPYEGVRKKRVTKHVGFVKLRSLEKISKNDVINYSLSSDSQYVSDLVRTETTEDTKDDIEEIQVQEVSDDEDVSNFLRSKLRDSLTRTNRKTLMFREQRSNDYSDYGNPLSIASSYSLTPSSSEYDYTYITALNTHKPLNVIKSINNLECLSTVMLPDTCISNVSRFLINNKQEEKFYSNGYSTDDDSDEKIYLESEAYNDRVIHSYQDKQYLNSKEFLEYFITTFQQTLAVDLKIPLEKLESATWKGASVYCAPWEIIPAIACQWPREANEWVYRQRDIHENPITHQKFQWPTPSMVSKVINLGCHLVPHGYTPKSGTNPQRDLEWKMIFPEAERFLECRLTNTQVKIYLITHVLLKTFVEPHCSNMFTLEHIRTHLFWQCEMNFGAWPEDYLGETLIRFLNSFLLCLKMHKLPNYFLPKQNLFENIPVKYLVDIHKRIFRIVENPVTHVLIAIRSLNGQQEFYPKLNYKQLYLRLTADDPSKILPIRMKRKAPVPPMMQKESDDDEKDEPRLGSIAYFDRRERRSRRRRGRQVRFSLDEKYGIIHRNQSTRIRRISVESVDTQVSLFKHMEVLRRKLIYEFFIEHFTECSKVSVKYCALTQSLIYLKQAERLCLLLADDQFNNEADNHRRIITEFKDIVEIMKTNSNQGPELPTRDNISEHHKSKNRFRSEQNIHQFDEKIYSNTMPTNNTSNNNIDYLSEDDNDDIESYNKQPVNVEIHFSNNHTNYIDKKQEKSDNNNEEFKSDVRKVTKLLENCKAHDDAVGK